MMSAASVTSFPRRSPPTILVVEDDVITRFHVCDELRARGLKVLEANSSDDAVAVLDRVRVDLLIIDIHLPGSRDGLDVARFVRDRFEPTQIILTSGKPDAPRVQDLDDVGVFVKKPYVVEQLLDVVSRRLNWPSASDT
jgi:DNA-binding response OmpR family regulator